MSTKEGIYFKSKSGKITLNTLMKAYKDLIPHNIQIIREVTVDNGFGHIISFAQENKQTFYYQILTNEFFQKSLLKYIIVK